MRPKRSERDPAPAPRAPATFDEWSAAYLESARNYLRARTWTNRRSLFKPLGAAFGARPLAELDAAALDRYAAARLAAGLRAPSVNNELRALRLLLRWVQARAGLAVAVTPRLLPDPARAHRVRPWSQADVERLLRCLEDASPQLVPIVTFLANTGCRRGEAMALEWERVDLAGRTAEICASDKHGWVPKTSRARTVPLNDRLVGLLGRLPRRGPFVFAAPMTGDRWRCWPQLQFDRARSAAGLVGGPHTLRHAYASHFLAAKPDLPLLARILGHSSERVTEIYAHLVPGQLEAARQVVDFGPLTKSENKSPDERITTRFARLWSMMQRQYQAVQKVKNEATRRSGQNLPLAVRKSSPLDRASARGESQPGVIQPMTPSRIPASQAGRRGFDPRLPL